MKLNNKQRAKLNSFKERLEGQSLHHLDREISSITTIRNKLAHPRSANDLGTRLRKISSNEHFTNFLNKKQKSAMNSLKTALEAYSKL
jgi:hypothetical protein